MGKKLKWIFIVLIFLIINLIFNFELWKELFQDKTIFSDNIHTEYVLETGYQNLRHFKSPYIFNKIFYPFEVNLSLNDPSTAYVLPYAVFRLILNSHNSVIAITVLNFLLNNLLMYLVLSKLRISHSVSILVSIVFGFTPFLSYRVIFGHYGYIPIYFFPLGFLIINEFLRSQKIVNKIVTSVLFGLFLGSLILSNFYYFFLFNLGTLFFIIYFACRNFKKFTHFLKNNWYFFVLSAAVFLLLTLPWILTVYQIIRTGKSAVVPGFGGAITLSADVVNFFTPGEYNPFYKILFYKLAGFAPIFAKINHFFINSGERFVYPGIIILIVYISVAFLKLRKQFPLQLWKNIRMYYVISIPFIVLMLGPFLKVFNRWFLNLDGVAVVFPLPFLILHYLPGLASLRAPSRFAPAFVFLASIVIAYTLDYVIKKEGHRKGIIIFTIIFSILIFDQYYVIPQELKAKIPNKIYYNIKNKPDGTVLEIPFTVRDGLRYLGFVHAIQPMYGQLIHGKPIIGGYIARIPDNIFNYYQKQKFIGYLSNLIDKGNYNPYKDKPKKLSLIPYPYPKNTINDELARLNVKYVVLKTDEIYSDYLINIFEENNFRRKFREYNYLLLEKIKK